MMSGGLTLLLGPQSSGGLALNQLIREKRWPLTREGAHVLPTRFASPLIRRVSDPERPFRERKAEFNKETEPRPAVLSLLNSFGPPQAASANGQFFPESEALLRSVGKIAGLCNGVIAIEPLTHLFLASGSAKLEAQVRATAWEDLYEMSWLDLVERLLHTMKAARLLVLTPKGMATRSPEVLARVFGAKPAEVLDPYWLTQRALDEPGQAALQGVLADGTPSLEMLEDLYADHAIRPDCQEIEDKLGIEKITQTLLEQRFEEDLAAITMTPRVLVI